jgi:hypothetical protein
MQLHFLLGCVGVSESFCKVGQKILPCIVSWNYNNIFTSRCNAARKLFNHSVNGLAWGDRACLRAEGGEIGVVRGTQWRAVLNDSGMLVSSLDFNTVKYDVPIITSQALINTGCKSWNIPAWLESQNIVLADDGEFD